jgi:predicted ATPase
MDCLKIVLARQADILRFENLVKKFYNRKVNICFNQECSWRNVYITLQLNDF